MAADGGSPGSPRLTRSEWALLAVLVAIQFTHIVDFVIIMPLGDRLRSELAITPGQFATVIAAYAWAAGLASLVAGLAMDRFDRKTILIVMYGGFAVSTLLCGLAPTYEWLLAGRTLAGVFGGLAAVALMSAIGDLFPPEKRGRATGAVISAFAVASIVGLPIGLILADAFGRGAPFIALSGLSAIVWVVGLVRLPAIRGHLELERRHPVAEYLEVIREPNHLRGFAFSFFLILGTFTVASFIGPVLASMNGWSETQLAVVYFVGGACTLVGTNLVGRLADRLPRLPLFRVMAFGALVMAILIGNIQPGPIWVAALATAAFMTCAAGRMVPAHAMLLGVAKPSVRGAFMSLNTSVQHLATGLAPTIAGWILVEGPDKKLDGFPLVGLVSASAAAISLVLAGFLRMAPPPPPIVEVKPLTTAADEEKTPACRA